MHAQWHMAPYSHADLFLTVVLLLWLRIYQGNCNFGAFFFFFFFFLQGSPSYVVLKISAPELFSGVQEGWQVCLLDNPGFGEDNKRIQQVANAAVTPSVAYVFLTTAASIGGTANAQFFRNLKDRDKSVFYI